MESRAASTSGTPPSGSPADAAVELGRVARPHGLDGCLLVVLHGEDPTNLVRAAEVTLDGGPGRLPFRVRRAEPAGQLRDRRARVRLWLEGIAVRERAEVWAGARVCIPESALPPLPEGEFYWRDLLGLVCRLPDGRALGVVEEIWPTGSNDVLVLREGARTLLVPALEEVLVRVDRDARTLWIDPPAGLLEEV